MSPLEIFRRYIVCDIESPSFLFGEVVQLCEGHLPDVTAYSNPEDREKVQIGLRRKAKHILEAEGQNRRAA